MPTGSGFAITCCTHPGEPIRDLQHGFGLLRLPLSTVST